MYSLIKTSSIRDLVAKHAPALGLSLLLAELFYKFHSFTLETLAFLATWYVIDALISIRWLLVGSRTPREHGLGE